MIRIIGIGSPFGDDTVGIAVARQIADSPPSGCEVVIADRPGMSLIDLMRDADAVILIDAVRSNEPAGTIHDLPLGRISALGDDPVSSHGAGVATAYALAEKLGCAPRRGRIIGIEAVPRDHKRMDSLSHSVAAALPSAVALVRDWAARLAAESEAT